MIVHVRAWDHTPIKAVLRRLCIINKPCYGRQKQAPRWQFWEKRDKHLKTSFSNRNNRIGAILREINCFVWSSNISILKLIFFLHLRINGCCSFLPFHPRVLSIRKKQVNIILDIYINDSICLFIFSLQFWIKELRTDNTLKMFFFSKLRFLSHVV